METNVGIRVHLLPTDSEVTFVSSLAVWLRAHCNWTQAKSLGLWMAHDKQQFNSHTLEN